jgi:hypothetical protein
VIPSCKQHRESLLDLARTAISGSRDAALAAHLETCEACSMALRNMTSQAEALTSLKRLGAPDGLDALVAHALAPEGRGERAGRAVASLSRRRAHAVLEAVVLGEGEMPREKRLAPSVLDRLVGEELTNPLASQARRTLGHLPRMPAPAELAARVEQELAQPRVASERPGRLLTLRPRHLTGLGVAAALVLWFAMPGRGPTVSEDYGFEIRRIEDLAGLDPMARDLLDGLTGGLLSAEGQR